MHRRIFTLDDQIAFAGLSGDNNPLHVDPVLARRYLFGKPIVHGVHALLWALDQWVVGHAEPFRLTYLQVAFLNQIGLHEEVCCAVVSEQGDRVRLDIFKGKELSVRIVFVWVPDDPGHAHWVSQELPEQSPPVALSNGELPSCCGILDLSLNPSAARRLVPSLMRHLCPAQAAVLLGMTRLVGVKCPGLHSIFSELKLTASDTGDLNNITYAVSEFDERYGLVMLAVSAPGLVGTIRAFVRPPPQSQSAFLDLKDGVGDTAFAGQRALVVGGSRGLGEVAAKLLAAGGAQVRLTYRLGKTDAQRVVDEILAGGGRASLCELDILQPRLDQIDPDPPTHLYYFASPLISGSDEGRFSGPLFHAFCDYYVTGFAHLVEVLQRRGLRHVFYPSTVFIDEQAEGFLEYTMAKFAGERLCQSFGTKYPEMHFTLPRLPKMATDQTSSMLPGHNPDPSPIMLAALLAMR